MARIAGINIPQNKVVSIALTYIHGIGIYSSKKICENLLEDFLTILLDELIIFRPLKEFPTDPLDNSIFPVNLWLMLSFPNGVFPNFPKFLKGYILLML